ncbi:MAG: polysaccharide biosynthesis/export family protein [Xanthobacteraceae bacterium]
MALLLMAGAAWSALQPLRPEWRANAEGADRYTDDARRNDRASRAAPPTSLKFDIGNKLRIVVYEKLELDEDKWSSGSRSSRPPSPSLLQRAELTGEYVIQDDGTFSLPLLGKFQAAGANPSELEASIASVFERELGRSSVVSVTLLERNPIYITGPVKNPGVFRYVAGMTVLHAVALAGGLEGASGESWQTVDSGRDTHSLVLLARMMARSAVVRAERDGAPAAAAPRRLVELLGDVEARNMIRDQSALRQLQAAARQAREGALAAAVDSARLELEAARSRVEPLEANERARTQHVDAVEELLKSGVLSRPALTQAQSELSDVQERRQNALSAVSSARQRLAQAIEEQAKFRIEKRTELDLEIDTADRELAEGLESAAANSGAVNVMHAPTAGLFAPPAYVYEIVRRNAKGVVILAAQDISEIEPGDIIRIRSGRDVTERPREATERTDSAPAARKPPMDLIRTRSAE